MPSVSLAAADPPLVLALDLGTSSLRALLFDRSGRAVADSEEQIPYRLRTTPDGGAEADAPPLFDLLVRCVDGALARGGDRVGEIVAVGISCFWHSLLGLDDRGAPTTPIFYWADTRSAPQGVALRHELDEAAVHDRTGCRFHSSYWPAKLRWLAKADPDRLARTHRWVSFAEYAARRLGGDAAATVSSSMASGTGLLNVGAVAWDEPLLDHLGLSVDRLPPIVETTTGTPLVGSWARRWPGLANVPWFPAIGDGAAANVGSGAVGPDRMALTVGTSGAVRMILPAPAGAPLPIPPDLWAYRLDRDHAVLGGAVSNGGNLLAWVRDLTGAPLDGPAMAAAATMAPDAHGLTLLPFVAGERAPGWHDGADAVVAGLTLATKPEHLLRAAMEAVALRLARIHDDLCPLAQPNHQIVVNGGAIVNSPVWLAIVADALGHDLLALPPGDEASARGAALVALAADDALAADALADPASGATPHSPIPDHHDRYRQARARQTRLETALFPDDAPPILPSMASPVIASSDG